MAFIRSWASRSRMPFFFPAVGKGTGSAIRAASQPWSRPSSRSRVPATEAARLFP